MPGLDGTGPVGQGSRTGRGRGHCNGNGQCYGIDRKTGFKKDYSNLKEMPEQDKVTFLNVTKENLEAELARVNERIEEIEEK